MSLFTKKSTNPDIASKRPASPTSAWELGQQGKVDGFLLEHGFFTVIHSVLFTCCQKKGEVKFMQIKSFPFKTTTSSNVKQIQ